MALTCTNCRILFLRETNLSRLPDATLTDRSYCPGLSWPASSADLKGRRARDPRGRVFYGRVVSFDPGATSDCMPRPDLSAKSRHGTGRGICFGIVDGARCGPRRACDSPRAAGLRDHPGGHRRVEIPLNGTGRAAAEGVLVTNRCCGNPPAARAAGARDTEITGNDASRTTFGVLIEGAPGENTQGLVVRDNRGVVNAPTQR